MIITARHQITGDTPKCGFHMIATTEGMIVAYPMLRLDLENPRLIANSFGRITTLTELARVWEYETVEWGKGAVLLTLSGIAPNARPHGFTDCAILTTSDGTPISEVEGGVPAVVVAADTDGHFMELQPFWDKQGNRTTELTAEQWDIHPVEYTKAMWKATPSDTWLKTLLARYWENASIRAFSPSLEPQVLNVCFGDEGFEETIAMGKAFFTQVLIPNLPRQVQNIHSIAVGVDCLDQRSLHAALEVNIRRNWVEDIGFSLWDMGIAKGIKKLDPVEDQLISEVMEHPDALPETVSLLWQGYTDAIQPMNVPLEEAPFMADWRVWVNACRLKAIASSTAAMSQAEVLKCYDTWHDLRSILETEHKLSKTVVSKMLKDLETIFFAKLNESCGNFDGLRLERAYLKKGQDLEFLIVHLAESDDPAVTGFLKQLLTADQKCASVTFYGAALVSLPTETDEQKKAFADVLTACLPCSAEMIASEVNKGVPSPDENKKLAYLYGTKFTNKLKQAEAMSVMEGFLKAQASTLERIHYLDPWLKAYLGPEEQIHLCLNLLNSAQYAEKIPALDDEIITFVYENRKGLNEEKNHKVLSDFWTRLFNRYTDKESDRELKTLVDKLDPDTSDVIISLLNDTTKEKFSEYRLTRIFDVFYGKCANKQKVRDELAKILGKIRQNKDGNQFETVKRISELLHEKDPDIYSEYWMSTQRSESFELVDVAGMDAGAIREMAGWVSDDKSRKTFSKILQQKRNENASFSELNEYVGYVAEKVGSDTQGQKWVDEQNRLNLQLLVQRPLDEVGDTELKTAEQWACKDPEVLRILCVIMDRFREEPTVKDFRRLNDMINRISQSEQGSNGWLIEQRQKQVDMILNAVNQQTDRLEEQDLDTLASWTGNIELRQSFEKVLNVARAATVPENDEQINEKLCQQFERQNGMVQKASAKQTAEDKDLWALKQKRKNVEHLLQCVNAGLPLTPGILKQVGEYADVAAKKNLSGYEIELLRYCESALAAGNTKPTEMLYARFETVGNNPRMIQWLKEQAKTELKEPLDATRLQEILNKAETKFLKRCDCTQEEFYRDNQREIEACIEAHFENTENLETLQQQAKQITCVPMKEYWLSQLNARRNELEGKYILSAKSVEELRRTRANLFAETSSGSAMDLCCSLVDQYTKCLETLSVAPEYTLGSGTVKQIEQYAQAYEACGDYAQHMGKLIHDAQDGKLYDAFKACKDRSFRHQCSAFMVKAASRSSAVDWSEMLNEIFPKEELSKAVKAPFKNENLSVLQRLLVLDDFAGSTEMYDAFADAVRKNSLLSPYIRKVRENEKCFKQYVDERITHVFHSES